MAISNIVISENPVSTWEQFHLLLPRTRFAEEETTKRDMGGDYQASFNMVPESRDEALTFLNSGLGRDVKFVSDDGIATWRGYVNTIRLSTGTATIENSLNDMANKVWVRYTPVGGGTVTRSTVYQSVVSQARYGIKEEIISGGEISLAVANQIAQNYLALNFWPRPTLKEINLSGSLLETPRLEISCHGYCRTLEWRTYNQTATTAQSTASVIVAAVITAVGQFVKSSRIQVNGTVLTQELDSDRRAADLLGGIADVGDSQGYVFLYGIEGDREFYYRQAAPPVKIL